MDVGALAPPAALAATSPIDEAQFVWGGQQLLLVQFSLARPGLVLVRPRMVAWSRLGRRRRLA